LTTTNNRSLQQLIIACSGHIFRSLPAIASQITSFTYLLQATPIIRFSKLKPERRAYKNSNNIVDVNKYLRNLTKLK